MRRQDLDAARQAVSALVGRDTDRMDGAACRRAAVESLSENLTDGFVSPVFWYVLAGLPGLVLFKVVSTMDSMVGYKTPRYLRFGWCGARLDDVMNYVPARATWLVIAALAAVFPGYSGRKAWTVGLRQHGLLLGPNSGWSEAATAGALERRIVGPIWLNGVSGDRSLDRRSFRSPARERRRHGARRAACRIERPGNRSGSRARFAHVVEAALASLARY